MKRFFVVRVDSIWSEQMMYGGKYKRRSRERERKERNMGLQIARRSRRRKARKAQLIPDHCPCTVDAGKNHENALLLGTIKAKNKGRDLNRFVDGPEDRKSVV